MKKVVYPYKYILVKCLPQFKIDILMFYQKFSKHLKLFYSFIFAYLVYFIYLLNFVRLVAEVKLKEFTCLCFTAVVQNIESEKLEWEENCVFHKTIIFL